MTTASRNVAIAVVACTAACACLRVASVASSPLVVLAAAIAFSFVNNTVFALLHEAVHGLFHPNRSVNRSFGIFLAGFFPTGFTFHRVCHLGHHARNRTSVELFDYITPDDNRLLKRLQWYGILTGIYWALPFVGCVAVAGVPWPMLRRALDTRGSTALEHAGASAMIGAFDRRARRRVRCEVAATLAIQVAGFLLLDVTWTGWLACYCAFGLNWSALQYADHAWSPLDVKRGAWDLRVGTLTRLLFLNYHYHLAHHLRPDVGWYELPRYVDATAPRPRFWRIYLEMWRGPKPLPPRAAGAEMARSRDVSGG